MPRHRRFRSMRVFPIVLRILGYGNQQKQPTEPTLISQRLLYFRRGFQLGAIRTSLLLLLKALVVRSVVAGKKSRGRAGASWALLSRAPSSRPGFTLLSRTKQTHSEPCSSVRGLAWHSMPITISWRR